MTPNGDTKGAENIFQENNKKFGIRVVGSRLIPRHVKRALMAVNTPSVQYRFHGAPFTERFLTQESNKMTVRLLPKMNMVRNHPLVLRYAPKNRGGLALPHYYVIQGTTQIKMAIRHLREKTPVGNLLHIHLQWTQLVVGKQEGILSDTRQEIRYVASNWWLKLRRFLNYTAANLYMEEAYTQPPNTTNDYAIMDEIIQNKTWTTKQLEMINACQLHLQMTYMSDLTAHPKKLKKEVQANQERHKWSRSLIKCPTQPQPGKQAWKEWQTALKSLVTGGWDHTEKTSNRGLVATGSGK